MNGDPEGWDAIVGWDAIPAFQPLMLGLHPSLRPIPAYALHTFNRKISTRLTTSTRTAADVYAQLTNAPEDFDFSKTSVPMRLAQYGEEQLVSRAQAKRVTIAKLLQLLIKLQTEFNSCFN